MANEEHVTILKQGVEAWNRWRTQNPAMRPDLTEVSLRGVNLRGVNFNNANLKGAILGGANLSNADFRGADLSGAELGSSILRESLFNLANLTGAIFTGANLIGTNFEGACLTDGRLDGADLSKAKLSGADLRDVNLSGADLSGTDLRNTNLTGARLSAKLNGADLAGALARSADFSGAYLIDADLTDTDLSDADLRGANFSGARLRRAILLRANLSETNLLNADFTSARLERNTFIETNLSQATGLHSIVHSGPSHITTDTLRKSGGSIPESFLRGCGLNDWEIEGAKLYDPGLSNEEINDIYYRINDLRVTRAFQINPLFISYSHSDSLFVDMIEEHLIKQGIRFWRDIHNAKAGSLEKQIDHAIYINDVVLLVLSEHSTESDWVEHEAFTARDKEKKTGKDALCPVGLDNSWKTCRWPGWLREQIMKYNILDFSNWQDEDYFQKMFGKLLEGLNLFYK